MKLEEYFFSLLKFTFSIIFISEWYGSSPRGLWCVLVALSVLLRLLAQIRRLWKTQGQQEKVRRGKYISWSRNVNIHWTYILILTFLQLDDRVAAENPQISVCYIIFSEFIVVKFCTSLFEYLSCMYIFITSYKISYYEIIYYITIWIYEKCSVIYAHTYKSSLDQSMRSNLSNEAWSKNGYLISAGSDFFQ